MGRSYFLFSLMFTSFVSTIVLAAPSISNGEPISSSEYSGVIPLIVNGKFHCSASLISPSLILTAAHCLTGVDPSKDRLNIYQFALRKFTVRIHPSYVPYQNDLAIIEVPLQEDRDKLKGIKPLKLAKSPAEIGDSVTLIGYGEGHKYYKGEALVHDNAGVKNKGFNVVAGFDNGRIVLKGLSYDVLKIYGSKEIVSVALPGDSGSPLLNSNDEIIGVDSTGSIEYISESEQVYNHQNASSFYADLSNKTNRTWLGQVLNEYPKH